MDLKGVLQKMGITLAFDDKLANFSGMSCEQLYISKVLQKAFIEVIFRGFNFNLVFIGQ